mmetsp:Transcript_11564/g.35185  ORF Transcript_11564/g.35185 Transcript_11564/m.35185 type:complete len:306 (+) Transcript_11564:1024-1941(+)
MMRSACLPGSPRGAGFPLGQRRRGQPRQPRGSRRPPASPSAGPPPSWGRHWTPRRSRAGVTLWLPALLWMREDGPAVGTFAAATTGCRCKTSGSPISRRRRGARFPLPSARIPPTSRPPPPTRAFPLPWRAPWPAAPPWRATTRRRRPDSWTPMKSPQGCFLWGSTGQRGASKAQHHLLVERPSLGLHCRRPQTLSQSLASDASGGSSIPGRGSAAAHGPSPATERPPPPSFLPAAVHLHRHIPKLSFRTHPAASFSCVCASSCVFGDDPIVLDRPPRSCTRPPSPKPPRGRLSPGLRPDQQPGS